MADAPTIRTTQLAPLVRRVWHDPTGRFERLPDPALSAWARGRIADAQATQAGDLAAARLYAPGGELLADPLEIERGEDGGVRIVFGLAEGERLYGAYDADARGLDRTGDHVHLVTELHPRGHHQLAGPCDYCAAGTPLPGREPAAAAAAKQVAEHEDTRAPTAAALAIGEESSSNYGELIVPLVISSRGYAVYVSNLSSSAVLDLGCANPERCTYTAQTGEADLYLLGPGTMPELVGEYARLTGHQPLPPAWTLGFLQSRFGYESFDHALSVLERFERERLPVHGLVFDVQWLEQHVNLRWDPQHFPDPEGNLARMAELGARAVVITEPGTRNDASNFAPGVRANAFAEHADGTLFETDQWYCGRGIEGYREVEPASGGLVNVFRESAADWWYEQHLPLVRQGVDAWWLDLNEPEDVDASVTFPDVDWPARAQRLDGAEVRNAYALAQQRAFAHRDLAHTDRRTFVLSRAGAAGSQRYGASPWSGDVGATWHDLRQQTHLTLTAGLCGLPLFGCDVGGFSGDPGPELFARWMQVGAFLPVFRAHGYMRDREPWSQGAEALEAVRSTLTLRAQLLPSLVTWAREALAAGVPLARPMLFDHPDDERFYDLADQWLLGPLLVAPVLHEGATERRVLLPAGEWVDVWSGDAHDGGGELVVPVDLGTTPVFVAAGSVLVADPEPLARRAYAWPPPQLHAWCFPGNDANRACATTLYVDDGITREHEQGAYCHLRVTAGSGDGDDDGLRVERLAGSWPTPRVRVASAEPGTLASPAGIRSDHGR